MQMKVEIIVYSAESIKRVLGFLNESDEITEVKGEPEEPEEPDMFHRIPPHFNSFEFMDKHYKNKDRRLDVAFEIWRGGEGSDTELGRKFKLGSVTVKEIRRQLKEAEVL